MSLYKLVYFGDAYIVVCTSGINSS